MVRKAPPRQARGQGVVAANAIIVANEYQGLNNQGRSVASGWIVRAVMHDPMESAVEVG
jgi:hypothetical protein